MLKALVNKSDVVLLVFITFKGSWFVHLVICYCNYTTLSCSIGNLCTNVQDLDVDQSQIYVYPFPIKLNCLWYEFKLIHLNKIYEFLILHTMCLTYFFHSMDFSSSTWPQMVERNLRFFYSFCSYTFFEFVDSIIIILLSCIYSFLFQFICSMLFPV